MWNTFNEKEKLKFLLLLISFFVLSILQALGAISILPFLHILTDPEILQKNGILSEIASFFKFKTDQSALLFFAFVSFCTALIANLFSLFVLYWTEVFYSSYGYRISYELFRTYLFQNYTFFLQYEPPQLIKNATEEIDRYVGGVLSQLIRIINVGMSVTMFLIIMLYVNFQLTIVTLLIFGPGYLIIYSIFKKPNDKAGEGAKEAISLRYKYLNLGLRAIKELKLYNAEKFWSDRYLVYSKERGLLFIKHKVIGKSPPNFFGALAFGGLLLVISLLISTDANVENIPFLALFLLAAYKIAPNLAAIYSSFIKITFHLPSFNTIYNHLNSNFELIDKKSVIDIKKELYKTEKIKEDLKFNKLIELKNISFSYSSNTEKLFDNLNLLIKKNETVGIVGESGVGKTTLIDMILGLLTNYSGSIFVDSKEINNSNLLSWQKKIGYVPQNIYLTDESLKNNIAFSQSDEKIDLKRIEESINLAELKSILKNNDLMTKFGEDAIRLSGGQKQRIAIARALYRNPDILIFDEATSSLDMHTAEKINNSIKKLSHSKTIIIISHNTKNLEFCDNIYELKEKKLIKK